MTAQRGATHIGWGYRDRAQFSRAATQFLSRGLARDELAMFVGDGTRAELRCLLASLLPDGHADIQTASAVEFYPVSSDRVLDPAAAVDNLRQAADHAVAEGYTGLRIVGDATPLVRHPDGRDAFAHYEFLADRVIAGLPIAAMCAFDVTALDDAAAELVCLHGEAGETVPDFRVHAAAGAAFALGGEIDAGSAALFDRTLGRVWPLLDGGDVVIDASGLGYLDHNALLRLDAAAGHSGHRIVLRDAGALVRRLVDLVRPANTAVEPAA